MTFVTLRMREEGKLIPLKIWLRRTCRNCRTKTPKVKQQSGLLRMRLVQMNENVND